MPLAACGIDPFYMAQEFHTYVFLFLAVGLAASVKFFVSELRKAQVSASTKPPPPQWSPADLR